MDGKQPCCPSCGQQLERSVAGEQCLVCLLILAADGGSLDEGEDTIERQVGLQQLGDYLLESEIARGGMGVVYRAHQISLNRTVAIKMLIAGQLATPDLVRRFYVEAEAAAKLDHPNIVPIYEVGELETLHFFSMKLIEGGNLSHLPDSYSLAGQLSATQLRERQRQIAGLVVKIADALAYAHDHGVLHRDIKPSNILIDTDSEPHLTDFGLAKLIQQGGTRLTLTSSVIGSPSYMAPEQAVGAIHQITAQADIYSLGAVLYELLTGQPPFLGETVVETIRQVTDQPPTRPRSLNGRIHPDLETIAIRCLEKEPHRRYASAADVGLELRRFLQGESIVARPVGPMRELWRWANRNRRVSLMAGMLLLALLIGTAGVAWQSRRATLANRELTETVSHLKWSRITEMVKQGEIRGAVARLADILRRDPANRQTATYTMSILDQSQYHVPVGARISHPGEAVITVAEFTPDETLLATGAVDRSVRIWNLDDSSLAIDPIVVDSKVEHLSFNRDGTLLAVSTSKGTLSIRRVRDGAEVFAETLEETITNLEFARSSQQLLFTVGSNLCLWRPESSPVVQRLECNKRIDSLSLSKDGIRVVTLFRDRTAAVWETPSGQELLHINKFRILDAVISENGQRIAASEKTFGSLVIWDLESRREISNLNTRFGDIDHLNFVAADDRIVGASTSHEWSAIYSCLTGQQCGPPMRHRTIVTVIEPFADGRYVMTLSKKNEMRFWNVETGESYAAPLMLPGGILHAGASQTGKFIWTGTNDAQPQHSVDIRSVQVWRLHTPQVPPDHSRDPERFLNGAAAASSDGRWVVTCIGRRANSERNFQPELTFVDAATGDTVRPPFVCSSDVYGCVFTPDNQKLLVVMVNGQIAVFSVPDFQLLQGPIDSGHPIQPSRLSPDGKSFATGSADGWVTLWELNTLSPLWKQRHSTARLNDLYFSADGQILASCSNDRTAKIWNTASGSMLTELIGHSDRIYNVRIDPATQTVATGGDDSDAILWDLASGEVRFRLPHVDRVYAIDFHPQQDLLAVASRDGRCQLWHTRTARPVGRPMILDQVVFNTKFSQDGSRLLCSGQAGFQLWDTSSQRPLTVLHRQVGQYAVGVDADGCRTMFIQDDSAVFCGSQRYSSRIWKLNLVHRDVPSWFPDFLESIVMQRLSPDTEIPQLVETDLHLKINQQIQALDDSDYVSWCKQWFESLKVTNSDHPIDARESN